MIWWKIWKENDLNVLKNVIDKLKSKMNAVHIDELNLCLSIWCVLFQIDKFNVFVPRETTICLIKFPIFIQFVMQMRNKAQLLVEWRKWWEVHHLNCCNFSLFLTNVTMCSTSMCGSPKTFSSTKWSSLDSFSSPFAWEYARSVVLILFKCLWFTIKRIHSSFSSDSKANFDWSTFEIRLWSKDF